MKYWTCELCCIDETQERHFIWHDHSSVNDVMLRLLMRNYVSDLDEKHYVSVPVRSTVYSKSMLRTCGHPLIKYVQAWKYTGTKKLYEDYDLFAIPSRRIIGFELWVFNGERNDLFSSMQAGLFMERK